LTERSNLIFKFSNRHAVEKTSRVKNVRKCLQNLVAKGLISSLNV